MYVELYIPNKFHPADVQQIIHHTTHTMEKEAAALLLLSLTLTHNSNELPLNRLEMNNKPVRVRKKIIKKQLSSTDTEDEDSKEGNHTYQLQQKSNSYF